jgi:exosome complex component RRP46
MINASSLALLNASSVPMRGLVSAVAVGRLSGGELVVDPSEEEATSLKAAGTFAFMFVDGIGRKNSNSECVWTSWKSDSGSYNQNEIFQARELARTGARAVYDAMRTSFEKPGMGAHEQVEEATPAETKSEEDDEMEI